jgi:threonylcarbamoyladenosine tRNA methylthiotransferase MtaB
MTSVFIHNFGCRVNQAEAFDWSERLTRASLTVVKDWRKAQVVVVNSCALTARAEADVRQFLRKVRRELPEVRLVLTGCLREEVAEELKHSLKLNLFLPNSAKDSLVEEVLRLTGSVSKTKVSEKRPYRSRALIKIQDGCNCRCTFCIIPYLRGHSRSIPLETVREKVQKAVEEGYGEVVLAGIHLCAYGQDLTPPKSLEGLLRTLLPIPGLRLLRLSSLDPRLLPESLLKILVSEEKVCPHFHLSLQHASESVLKKMGRRSTALEYQKILGFLRSHRPEASLGADIIVGFPGEEESDYQFLKNFLQESPLNYFHVFIFSPRAGTPAERWKQVPESVKKRRSEELRKLSREKNLDFKKSFIGRTLPAVVVRKKEKQMELLTSNYLKVQVEEGSGSGINLREVVKVRILQVEPFSVRGEVV